MSSTLDERHAATAMMAGGPCVHGGEGDLDGGRTVWARVFTHVLYHGQQAPTVNGVVINALQRAGAGV